MQSLDSTGWRQRDPDFCTAEFYKQHQSVTKIMLAAGESAAAAELERCVFLRCALGSVLCVISEANGCTQTPSAVCHKASRPKPQLSFSFDSVFLCLLPVHPALFDQAAIF